MSVCVFVYCGCLYQGSGHNGRRFPPAAPHLPHSPRRCAARPPPRPGSSSCGWRATCGPAHPTRCGGRPTDPSTPSPPLVAHGSAGVPMLFPRGRLTPRPLVAAGHHCDQLAMAASATSAATSGAALNVPFRGVPSGGALLYRMVGSTDGGSVDWDDADRFEIGSSNTFGDRNVGAIPVGRMHGAARRPSRRAPSHSFRK